MDKESKQFSKLDFPTSFFKNRHLLVDILTAFVGLLVITVLIVILYTYHNNSKAILTLSDDLINQVTKTVIEKTANYLEPAAIIIEMSSRAAETGTLSLTDSDLLEIYAIEVLKAYPQLARFIIGDEQGNFLMLKKQLNGAIDTKIINQQVTPATVTWKYRNQSGAVINIETSHDVKFDPRIRPWYKGAKESGKNYWTDLYIFFSDQKPGVTTAYPANDSNGNFFGVFGADIELGEISNFLKTLKIGKTGQAFILNNKNEFVAYPDVERIVKKVDQEFRPLHLSELEIDWISASLHHREKMGRDKFVYKVKGKRYIGSFIDFPESFDKDWRIGIVVPEDDFIGAIKKTNRVTVLISLVILLIAVSFAIYLSRTISRPIVLLTKEAEKIKDFQLDGVNISTNQLVFLHRKSR